MWVLFIFYEMRGVSCFFFLFTYGDIQTREWVKTGGRMVDSLLFLEV